jgi:hypothetical protein
VIWLAWRQQRTETVIAALLLALVVALLVPTGLHMASVYESDGIAACLADSSGNCRQELDAFVGRWDRLVSFVGWLNLVPALVGALLAAPFVLDFERGTFRLAWTQSVTRGRWLALRLALIVAAVLAVSALFTLLMTWWRNPLDDVNGRFSDGFDLEGVMPSAYALFAAALVISLGVVLRRTAAAIGLALVTFLAVRIVIGNWARPNYQSPIEETRRGDFGADLHGAWIFNQGGEFRVGDGELIGVFSRATYHPESRFWLFQAIEAGIFATLTLALLAFAVWWIRKRIS